MKKLFFLFVLAIAFTACDNLYYEDISLNHLLEGVWEQHNFYIDEEAIVFDVRLHLKADNSFRMVANVLGKKNTSFLEYDWTGIWLSQKDSDVFELTYNNDFGIIGYYLEENLNQENYLMRMENGDLILTNNVGGHQFKLILNCIEGGCHEESG